MLASEMDPGNREMFAESMILGGRGEWWSGVLLIGDGIYFRDNARFGEEGYEGNGKE